MAKMVLGQVQLLRCLQVWDFLPILNPAQVVEAAVAELKATTYLFFLVGQVAQARQLVVAIAAQVDKAVMLSKMQLLWAVSQAKMFYT
jgi:hypothetical protein